ncbi:hypothetical protein, partial [Brevundimonas sp.]|uniref:hypothetical protein n=1 Tax=Brevundimonas sp. TaxID=1871086 RepID=UPI002ED904EB
MRKTLMTAAAAFALTLAGAGAANAQIAGGLGGGLGGSVGGSVGGLGNGLGGSLGGAGSGSLTGGVDGSFVRDRVDGAMSRADRARANAERRA